MEYMIRHEGDTVLVNQSWESVARFFYAYLMHGCSIRAKENGYQFVVTDRRGKEHEFSIVPQR